MSFDTYSFPKVVLPRNETLADRQYEIIMENIGAYEKSLDSEHEVSLMLASFGQSVLMQVTSIGYCNPHTIIFEGFVNGQKSRLVQHISQLSVLLTSSPKSEPDKPARRIGFNVRTD